MKKRVKAWAWIDGHNNVDVAAVARIVALDIQPECADPKEWSLVRCTIEYEVPKKKTVKK